MALARDFPSRDPRYVAGQSFIEYLSIIVLFYIYQIKVAEFWAIESAAIAIDVMHKCAMSLRIIEHVQQLTLRGFQFNRPALRRVSHRKLCVFSGF